MENFACIFFFLIQRGIMLIEWGILRKFYNGIFSENSQKEYWSENNFGMKNVYRMGGFEKIW